MNPGTENPERLRFGPSVIHGVGAFAAQLIPRGSRVLEYVGEIIDKHESLRRCALNNECIFSLDAEHDIDGKVPWNPARFINHSCAPNCDAIVEEGRVWIVAARDVTAGEELTFNYGFDLEDYRDYPCSCGAANCVGYIVAEEFFEHARKRRDSTF